MLNGTTEYKMLYTIWLKVCENYTQKNIKNFSIQKCSLMWKNEIL